MKNLIDNVCSYESAKQLKELGVPQESMFYWIEDTEPKLVYLRPDGKFVDSDNSQQFNDNGWNKISAFTSGELGMLLPIEIKHKRTWLGFIGFDRYENGWTVYYANGNEEVIDFAIFFESKELIDNTLSITDEKEAEARAKMLIFIRKNKIVEY